MSIAVVCKDNALTIGRTLESLRAFLNLGDELLVVDSGSTDGTLALLEAAGARVIKSPWLGHIKTKQLALESCTYPWIFSIDSDESLESELIESIMSVRHGLSDSSSGFVLRRMTYYQDRPLKYVWQPEWRLRLVRKDKARWGGFDPHDKLELIDGTTPQRLSGILRHDSFPTFSEHMRKQWQHATTMAQSLHSAGVRGSALRLLTAPGGAMFKQLVLKQGFRDGVPGLLAATSTALASLIKNATLLELDLNKPRP